MKKDFLIGCLFFGSIWGLSEVALGGHLYHYDVPYASVPLTVIAFMVVTVGKIYLPQKASATVMGSVAMLYKFLNTPFFACHLLAIFLLGFAYDLVTHVFKVKSKALLGLLATYAGYILFAVIITYVIRYRYWVEEGLPRVLRYVGISGTLTAVANCIAVPLGFRLGQVHRQKMVDLFSFRSRLATGSVSMIIAVIWLLGIVQWF